MKPAAALACLTLLLAPALARAGPPGGSSSEDSGASREDRPNAAAEQRGGGGLPVEPGAPTEPSGAKEKQKTDASAAKQSMGDGGVSKDLDQQAIKAALGELKKEPGPGGGPKALQELPQEAQAGAPPDGPGGAAPAGARKFSRAPGQTGSSGGAKDNAAAPAAGADARDVVVTKKSAADTTRIGTTSSGRHALKDMSRFGRALDQGYKSDEASAPGADASASGASKLGAPGASGASSAGPGALDDMALAALTGRRRALDALGLRVERDGGLMRVLRGDGTPASKTEVAALAQALAAEPRALDRRPDFFHVLPPEHYQALKRDFASAAAATPAAAVTPAAAAATAASAAPRPQFQDVGLAGRRDFEWTRSCSEVSGGCNPLAAERHYDRGRDVSPETLEAIYRALPPDAGAASAEGKDKDGSAAAAKGGDSDDDAEDLGDFDAGDEKVAEAARAAEGVSARHLALGGIGRRLQSLFGGFSFGGGQASGPSRAPGVSRAVVTTGVPGSVTDISASGGNPRRRGPDISALERISQASSAPGGKDAAPRGGRGAGLLALGAAAAAAWALRRLLR